MSRKLNKYNQYKKDFFEKLNFTFVPGKKILDVGCGDCTDAEIFNDYYQLKVDGMDVYKHVNVLKNSNLKFKLGSADKLPYPNNNFDYVFMHDVLHHVDEPLQRKNKLVSVLKELRRVVKEDGTVIIAEGNRFNPLFYPHMVLMHGHMHFPQDYFKKIVSSQFSSSTFKFFEAHLYPPKWMWFFKIYEFVMEKLAPKQFLAYNVAILKK